MLMADRLMEFLKYLYNMIITILLKIPPAILNMKADIVPPNIDPRSVLKNITVRASFHPRSINAVREIVFASPSFIPGNKTGI